MSKQRTRYLEKGKGGRREERERDDGGICVEASEREREREEGNQREEVTE